LEYSVDVIVFVSVVIGFTAEASGATGAATAGRSWLLESWDEEVVIEVFGSFPVRELRPRKAVRTRIKVSAIFDDLPASSAAFL
jgi:hypothetical protein